MSRRIQATVTGLALGVLIAFGAQAQTPKKMTLRLDWTALGYHAPFYLGVARGWYREAGIDLQVLEGKGLAQCRDPGGQRLG
ncbi:MAG: ABC transporter substrate-binding protein [Pseudomonadota bacterium]